MPNPLLPPQSKLCERCSLLDFDNFFAQDQGFGSGSCELSVVILGKVGSWDLRCVLCTYFHSQAHSIWGLSSLSYDHAALKVGIQSIDSVEWELRLCDTSPLVHSNDSSNEPDELRGQGIGLVLGPRINVKERWSPSHQHSQVILPSIGEATFKSRHCSRLIGDYFDGQEATKWLQECENTHKFCFWNKDWNSFSGFDSSLMRLIDCHTGNLIRYEGQAYAALSYIWGKQSLPSEEEDRTTRTSMRLPVQIPQTIKDAMSVAKDVGHQFLWVDRYCVDQYHSPQKIAQLNAMAGVYEQAALTIVVLTGSATSGIPGVSFPRQRSQLILRSALQTFMSSGLSARLAEELSPHNARAWTLQERAVSRRCLMFSDEQSYFICRSYTACESLLSTITHRANLSHWDKLWETIFDERIREMTYDSDALNVFRGLIARQEFCSFFGHYVSNRVDFGRGEVYGSRSDGRYFLRSLLWFENKFEGWSRNMLASSKKMKEAYPRYTRKKAMPTWSWASSRLLKYEKGSSQPIRAARESLYPYASVILGDLKTGIRLQSDNLSFDHHQLVLPETSTKIILLEAPLIKVLDLDDVLKDWPQFGYTVSRASALRTQRGKSIARSSAGNNAVDCRAALHFDRESGLEIEDIIRGKAQLNAILLHAEIVEPEPRPALDYSAAISSNETEDREYSFLLVHQPKHGPAKRVGVCKMILGAGTMLNIDDREMVEII